MSGAELSGEDRPRPRDLALMWLAAASGPPRQRAREQQSDLAGEVLRKRILKEIVELDPEPEELVQAIESIVMRMEDQPRGPTRALGLLLSQEWAAVRDNPAYWEWQLSEALHLDRGAQRRGSRGAVSDSKE